MKLIFVRHGKDDDKYRGGWSSMDLTPEGMVQAKQLSKHLADNKDIYKITHIISSDLTRALTTANIISLELGLPVEKECRLREINNGDLSGMLNDVANEKYPDLFFRSLEMDEHYPNGESPKEFYQRIENWFSVITSCYSNTSDNVLIVTHGGVINIIYHMVKELAWSNKAKSFKSGNCSIHVLNTDTMKFEVENKIDFLTI